MPSSQVLLVNSCFFTRCRAAVQKISNIPWEDLSGAQRIDEVGPTAPLSCHLDTARCFPSVALMFSEILGTESVH